MKEKRSVIKGICPVCGEAVELARLVFAKKSGVTQTAEEKRKPLFLCVEHPAKDGRKTTSLVDETTGVIHKLFCDGSFRPKKEFVH